MENKEGIIQGKYEKVVSSLIKSDFSIGTMESCTGGYIVSCLTNVEGSSKVVRGGIVTYCNDAKVKSGVDSNIISRYGVYSLETAEAMAKNACEYYESVIGIGVTGTFANIDEANGDSVPGEVYIGIYDKRKEESVVKTRLELTRLGSRVESKNEVAEFVADRLIDCYRWK